MSVRFRTNLAQSSAEYSCLTNKDPNTPVIITKRTRALQTFSASNVPFLVLMLIISTFIIFLNVINNFFLRPKKFNNAFSLYVLFSLSPQTPPFFP